MKRQPTQTATAKTKKHRLRTHPTQPIAQRLTYPKVVLPQRFRHSKRTKGLAFSRLRWIRFIPAAMILSIAVAVYIYQPGQYRNDPLLTQAVLGYSTGVSTAGMLTQTNLQRSQNGLGLLALNATLNQAAQTKANDMVARDYWAHNTPDGKEPWFFFKQAGYSYSYAGENLAFGFMTDSDVLTGWMNSGPHRANVLSGNYTEVGFGFASSEDFTDHGPQTVVVALYGKPLAAVAPPAAKTAPAPVPVPAKHAPTPTPSPAQSPAPQPAPPTPAPAPLPSEVKPLPQQTASEAGSPSPAPVTEEAHIRKIQLLTDGNAIWSAGAVVTGLASVIVLWVFQRGFHLHRFIMKGEHYFISHLHLDLTVAAFFVLGAVLLQGVGVVR